MLKKILFLFVFLAGSLNLHAASATAIPEKSALMVGYSNSIIYFPTNVQDFCNTNDIARKTYADAISNALNSKITVNSNLVSGGFATTNEATNILNYVTNMWNRTSSWEQAVVDATGFTNFWWGTNYQAYVYWTLLTNGIGTWNSASSNSVSTTNELWYIAYGSTNQVGFRAVGTNVIGVRNSNDTGYGSMILSNLTILGTQNVYAAGSVEISTNYITMNANLTNEDPMIDAFINVERGPGTNATIKWDEAQKRWMFTVDAYGTLQDTTLIVSNHVLDAVNWYQGYTNGSNAMLWINVHTNNGVTNIIVAASGTNYAHSSTGFVFNGGSNITFRYVGTNTYYIDSSASGSGGATNLAGTLALGVNASNQMATNFSYLTIPTGRLDVALLKILTNGPIMDVVYFTNTTAGAEATMIGQSNVYVSTDASGYTQYVGLVGVLTNMTFTNPAIWGDATLQGTNIYTVLTQYGKTNHADLMNLGLAASGHTGFQPTGSYWETSVQFYPSNNPAAYVDASVTNALATVVTAHSNATGTAVHGLGTASTNSQTNFVMAIGGSYGGSQNWQFYATNTSYISIQQNQIILSSDMGQIAINGTGAAISGAGNPSWIGNGTSLTNLNADNLASGTVGWDRLPSYLVTNNGTGYNLDGTFTGNGSGLTYLNADNISSGTLSVARLHSSVITNQSSQSIDFTNAAVSVADATEDHQPVTLHQLREVAAGSLVLYGSTTLTTAYTNYITPTNATQLLVTSSRLGTQAVMSIAGGAAGDYISAGIYTNRTFLTISAGAVPVSMYLSENVAGSAYVKPEIYRFEPSTGNFFEWGEGAASNIVATGTTPTLSQWEVPISPVSTNVPFMLVFRLKKSAGSAATILMGVGTNYPTAISINIPSDVMMEGYEKLDGTTGPHTGVENMGGQNVTNVNILSASNVVINGTNMTPWEISNAGTQNQVLVVSGLSTNNIEWTNTLTLSGLTMSGGNINGNGNDATNFGNVTITNTFTGKNLTLTGNSIAAGYYSTLNADAKYYLYSTANTKQHIWYGSATDPILHMTNSSGTIILGTGINSSPTNALKISAGTNAMQIGDTGPLTISNATSIVGNGSGLTNLNNVLFDATHNTDIPMLQASYIVVTNDVEYYDIGGNYNHSTGVFTVPANGYYSFTLGFYGYSRGAADVVVALYTNEAPRLKMASPAAGLVAQPFNTGLIYLTNSTPVTMRVYCTTVNSNYTETSYSYFKGKLEYK